MSLDGDKGRTILAMVIARAWKDPGYRSKFLSNPAQVLTSEGADVPKGVSFTVVSDQPGVKYIPLSHDLDVSQNSDRIVALMRRVLPIPAGKELRFVQSTPDTRYLVLPLPPPSIDPATTSESDLMKATADSGVEATFHDTSQSVEAESTEVTVTETSEVQDAETSTTVVAEAELVAT